MKSERISPFWVGGYRPFSANPGQRPGQIHFQDNKNNKYLYNNKDGRFYSRDPKTNKWNVPAPNRINEQLSNPNVQRAIQTGNLT